MTDPLYPRHSHTPPHAVDGNDAAQGEIEELKAKLRASERVVAKLTLREPDREEMGAALGALSEVFALGWTIRRCRHCDGPVAGGPTACVRCVYWNEAIEAARQHMRTTQSLSFDVVIEELSALLRSTT